MRSLQKLVANGNSTQVTIRRNLLAWLGWLPGEAIIVEATEQKTLIIRRPAPDEFLPKRAVSVLIDAKFPEVTR